MYSKVSDKIGRVRGDLALGISVTTEKYGKKNSQMLKVNESTEPSSSNQRKAGTRREEAMEEKYNVYMRLSTAKSLKQVSEHRRECPRGREKAPKPSPFLAPHSQETPCDPCIVAGGKSNIEPHSFRQQATDNECPLQVAFLPAGSGEIFFG